MVQGFFGVLLEALEIFLGFDFCPHSIIPITRNPEYPPWESVGSLQTGTTHPTPPHEKCLHQSVYGTHMPSTMLQNFVKNFHVSLSSGSPR